MWRMRWRHEQRPVPRCSRSAGMINDDQSGGMGMHIGNVSTLSITSMMISAVLSVLVPITLIIVLGIKKRMNWKAMLLGALLFFVFVMILESIMHRVVLGPDPATSALVQNKWLYMIYAGFAAGIFEETARLLGFKFLIRVSENESIDTGISYGLGHGGIEAVIIGGLSAIGNLTMSLMHNSGALSSAADTLTGSELEAVNESIRLLTATPSYMFLMSGFERMVALVLQISLSLFVLKAVSQKKWLWFLYAILIHAGVDMFAVLYGLGVITNVFVLEGVLAAAAIIIAVVAFRTFNGRERSEIA